MSTTLKNSGLSTRNLIGIALIGIVLAVLPFVIGLAGQSWVRILHFALLYVMLSLGLNIVVGFAGLLDPVSYTHLDVYKRQPPIWSRSCAASAPAAGSRA